jgi:pimeloyl-ACP methyl ester carboxylesterase
MAEPIKIQACQRLAHHYLDEGAGDPVVHLHGNPAWGFLYRKFVKPLTAAGRRVIVPDMIGFGLSEKPFREQAHSLDGHIANLTSLLQQLDVRNATMVCHDRGGPTGLGFALSNSDRVRALVIMSTWAWPLPPAEFHKRILPYCVSRPTSRRSSSKLALMATMIVLSDIRAAPMAGLRRIPQG